MSIEKTLHERGTRYGDFADHAKIAQGLQRVMQKAERASSVIGQTARPLAWDCLSDVQRQALTVIADKIARILSGDPNYADNWHDIQGYAKLVEDRIVKKPVETVANAHEGALLSAATDAIITGSGAVRVEHVCFDEQRADIIGQNGNDGEHYAEFACREPERPKHICPACSGGHSLHRCSTVHYPTDGVS